MLRTFLSMAMLLCLMSPGARNAAPDEPLRTTLAYFNPQKSQRTFALTYKNIKYWLFLPQKYGLEKHDWPLVVFLHGAGERGKGFASLKENVTINLLNPLQQIDDLKELPFILVTPLCPANQYWNPSQVHDVMEEVMDVCEVNAKRIYLTGHSMGAFGTWQFACTYPRLLAAAIPVSGGSQTCTIKNMIHIPTWAFHGEKDNVVPAYRSRVLVDILKRAGADIKITLFPELGHSICKETYSNPDLWKWMLAQEKN